MSELLIGLDIGGTATRAALFDGGRPVREARGGSANVQNVTREAAEAALREVLAPLAAGPATPVVAGAGGVDTPRDAAQLEALIRSAGGLDPATPVTAVHDTRLLLAAGGHTTGIALIAGTGSVAWGVDATGVERRAGGWGYLLGDEGSGYWLGREAVRAVVRAGQREPAGLPDAFERAVLRHAGAVRPVELIAAFHGRPERRFWAGLSPVVTDHAHRGHPLARELVTAAAQELRALVTAVASGLREPLPVVIGGGLATTVVGAEVAAGLSRAGHRDVTVLRREPVLGAPLLASALPGAR